MKKWLLIVVALVVVFGTIFFTVGTRPMKKMMLQRVRTELAKTLPCRFTMGEVRVEALRGVEVKNLRLLDIPVEAPADATGRQMLGVKSLRLTFGLKSLLNPRAPFTGIELDHASLMVVREQDGRVNLLEFWRQLQSQDEERGSIRRVKLTDVRVDWLDYASRTTPVHETFRIPSAELYKVDDTTYRLGMVRVQTGDTEVMANGSLNTQPGQPVDIRVKVSPLVLGDVIRLARTLPATGTLPMLYVDGRGTFDGRIFGLRGKERAEGTLTLSRGKLGKERLRRAFFRVVSKDPDVMELEDGSVRMNNGGLLLLQGSLTSLHPAEYTLDVTARNFPIQAAIGVFDKHPGLTGGANGKMSLKGTEGEMTSMNGEGEFEMRDGRIAGAATGEKGTTPYQRIATRFTVANGAVQFEEGKLESDTLWLDLKGSVGFERQLDLSGECIVSKQKIERGFFKRLVSKIIEDNAQGYRFPVRVGGTLDAPDISLRTSQAAVRGASDCVRDAGNRIEKVFKKIF